MRRLLANLPLVAAIFLLPLVGSPPHLMHPAPWLGLLCGTVMLASQPKLVGHETLSLSAADRGSALGIFIAMILAQVVSVADFRFSPPVAPGIQVALGSSLVVAGMTLRLWAISTLGRFFTANVRVAQDQRVVESGPYALLRHPSYTGALLAALGTSVALGSVWGSAAVLALGLPAYLYRIAIEEQRLATDLGAPYREYMRRTRRLVPGVF